MHYFIFRDAPASTSDTRGENDAGPWQRREARPPILWAPGQSASSAVARTPLDQKKLLITL